MRILSVCIDEQMNKSPGSFSTKVQGEFSRRYFSMEKVVREKFVEHRARQLLKICQRECVNDLHCRGYRSYFPSLAFGHNSRLPAPSI